MEEKNTSGFFKGRKGIFLAVLLIVAAVWFVQRGYMNEFPVYYHAWAQDDRYALALGFLDNHFDLLHPQTMIYNKQFPDWWETASDNTITAVDFPIHEYVVAALMRLMGSTAPWVFRLWTLLLSLVGMVYLYKTAMLLTQNRAKSLLVTAYAMASPVYAFYFNGFLPGVPAFAFGIVGLWLYLRYRDSGRNHLFRRSLVFLTLATLMRTTFAIELIAILGFELLRILRKESLFKGKVLPVLLSACAIGAYLWWNGQLRARYGSLFLSELMPPESLADAKEILRDAKETWQYHYFQKLQYMVLLIAAVIALVFSILKHKNTFNNKETKRPLSLGWLAAIYLFGCVLFTIAMMQQLPQHDYYFIDTFLLPVLLTFILLLRQIPEPRSLVANLGVVIVAGVLCITMLVNVRHTQETRRSGYDRASITHTNFEGSDHFLDSIGIPREAKILALYAYPQNGPFIQMQRKGYTVMWHKDSLIEAATSWDFDCIVIENDIFNTYFDERKALLGRLHRMADSGRIAVCTLSDSIVSQNLEDFYK